MLIALAMLRRRINPHESPIYRLYPELLSHIASRLTTGDLVKTTHVSYHWRTVLLAHPDLWSTLDFTDPQRASTFLTRSKSVTIRVFLPKTIAITPLLFELLEQSAERIATLRVGDYIHQKELLLRTMPSLRTLEFHAHSGADVLDEETRLSFPVLKTLFFHNRGFPLFSVPRLTRFRFTHRTYGDEALDGLLDFLDSCPLLEELEIFHVEDFHIRRHHHPVNLLHLRAYTHHTNWEFSLHLYHMLSCPSSCSVTFSSSGEVYEITDVFASRQFRNSTFRIDARRVKLKAQSTDREYDVEGMVEVIDGTHRRFRSAQGVSLEDATSAWKEVFANIIHPLYLNSIKGLDARLIEILCIEELALWSHEEWRRAEGVLGHLENLRTLILHNSAMVPYLQALVPAMVKDISKWRCPKLDTLVIRTRYLDPGEGVTLLTNMLFKLCRVVEERKLAGFPLRSVSVFLCNTWEQLESSEEELREFIKTFTGTFELVVGDGALDWNVDDYFLEGLDHVRRDQQIPRNLHVP